MRRRDFLKAIGACAVCAAPGAMWAIGPEEQTVVRPGTAPNPAHGKRPNVILVLCDDLGWGDLGAFWQNSRAEAGNVHIDTPNLDEAMRRGVMLTNAYTTSPVCAPARASMVSGKHQGHCNLRDNMFDRPVDAHMTLGTVMKQAGYATWHIGKWGIGGGYESGGQPRRAMACDAGFDYSYGYPAHAHGHSFYHWAKDEGSWRTLKVGSPVVENVSKEMYDAGRYLNLSRGYNDSTFEQDPEGTYYRRQVANTEVRYCYDTDLFTAKIKQLIDDHLTNGDKKQPFFCYACYTTVHGAGSKNNQGDPTLSSLEDFHVPGRAYPALDDTDKRWGGGVAWEKDEDDCLPFKEGVEGDANTSNTYIYPEYQGYGTASQCRYATNVRRLDDALGDLLHFLKVRGLAEDTLFIFTSDNGPAGEYLYNSAGNQYGLAKRIDWVETDGFDSNGPFKGMKRWCYEGGLREPTFVLWPGTVPASGTETPRASDVPFQFPAWMATLADVAGLPQPAHCDGVSLLPTLMGEGRQLPMRIYAEYEDGGSGNNWGFEQMVRDGDYVLIRVNGVNGKRYLYNIKDDIGQEHDLSGDPAQADRLRWMTALLTTCRLPIGKTQAAYGCAGFGTAHSGADATPMPATPLHGALPQLQVRVFRTGAKDWPWVPNFRTLEPDAGFLAVDTVALRERLAKESVPFGVAIDGWMEVDSEREVTFTAKGEGGCQLWLHEAHILEYEAGDCATGRSIAMRLAKGRHPYRLYLTAPNGPTSLCAVSAGDRALA